MIKAIIFDCFGVVFSDNFEDNYRKFGGDPVEDKSFLEEVIFTLSTGEEKNFNRIIAERLTIPEETWAKANNSGRSFNTELLTYITELRKLYIVSLLSNIGSDGLEAFMDYSILEKHFDDIVESAKIGFAKPEARAYEVAADRLKVRLDECIFIDDREKYTEGATHVGMKAILYKDFTSFKNELELLLS